jgi:tRNA threonylcarbamoyladenosine biosynthesis protein TsaB
MILYINTKDPKIIEVALKKDDQIVAKMSDENQYGSQVLLPLIIKILKSQNLQFIDLHGIEVEIGPGSYTGLRVGVAVAQALGFALGIPINGEINKTPELHYT